MATIEHAELVQAGFSVRSEDACHTLLLDGERVSLHASRESAWRAAEEHALGGNLGALRREVRS